jgi:hypothetical protein
VTVQQEFGIDFTQSGKSQPAGRSVSEGAIEASTHSNHKNDGVGTKSSREEGEDVVRALIQPLGVVGQEKNRPSSRAFRQE